jgi:hypothetical protein
MPPELFDPEVDGWFFGNWGEPEPFAWDLFRETYLGVNPTQDCVAASADCVFFELFKKCAKDGNCGGMSLLALALYKYGGYFGFCKPANFYTGGEHRPDRVDLRRAINIIQARQFNVNGIRNFLDMEEAKTLNNAVIALQRVKELLGSGDYPVLSLSNGIFGESAHTVLPYNYEDGPGWPKYLHIWDPNFPADSNPGHYSSAARKMTINGPTNWTYASKDVTYNGTSNGWCFVVPMSIALIKARHPMSIGMVIDALMTLFITGSGAAVGQISDEKGRRLYSADADIHTLRGDLETDPAWQLPGCCRWPWFGKRRTSEPYPEVYFSRRAPGVSSRLTVSLNGTKYRAVYGGFNNLVTVESSSKSRGRDLITISALGTTDQSVDIIASQNGRRLALRQSRMGVDAKAWRAFEVRNLDLMKGDSVTVDVTRDFSSVMISGGDREIPFDLRIEQMEGKKAVRRDKADLVSKPGKLVSLMPGDWGKINRTRIRKEEIAIPGRRRQDSNP